MNRVDDFLEKVYLLGKKERIAVAIFSIAAIGAAFWYLALSPAIDEHRSLVDKLDKLGAEVADKRMQAGNLPKVKADYETVRQKLSSAILELPNDKEIPALMVSIADAGRSRQVDFVSFKPRPEQKKEFYAEVPADITIRGSYHAIGGFFAGVAQLPRIVGLSNLNVAEVKQGNDTATLKMTGVVTTYRFLDESEARNDAKK